MLGLCEFAVSHQFVVNNTLKFLSDIDMSRACTSLNILKVLKK